jgi:allantoin racemase
VRILLINPNSSRAMTDTILASARGVAGPGVDIVAVCSTEGPAAIESHTDEALATTAMLPILRAADADGFDGVVIACFGDPGLDAARELVAAPVVGIAEAAMQFAVLVGRRFSVVTTLSRTLGRASDLVRRYGATDGCVSMYAAEVPVLDLEDTSSESYERIALLCERAVREDGADVIVLGCAGMSDLCDRLSARVGVPVVDGVAASVGIVAGLVRMGLATNKSNEYARPPVREATGRPAATEILAVGAR